MKNFLNVFEKHSQFDVIMKVSEVLSYRGSWRAQLLFVSKCTLELTVSDKPAVKKIIPSE